jgi:Integrase core domain
MERILKRNYYDRAYKTSYTSKSTLIKNFKDKFPAKDIAEWADKQKNITRFAPAARRFPRQQIFAHKFNDIWMIDLASMQKFAKWNRNYKYFAVLTCCLSRFTYVFKLKSKKSDEVVDQLKKLFKKVKPKLAMAADKGGEFSSKKYLDFLKSENIQDWKMQNTETKASLVEARIKLIKSRIYKNMAENDNKKWIDILDDSVRNVNETYTKNIGMSPAEAISDLKNEKIIFLRLYSKKVGWPTEPNSLKLGEKLRISHYKTVFRKGFLENFSEELFTLKKVIPRDNKINLLQLEDSDGEVIKGLFYPREVRIQK